ncbi:MAG: type II toxin-antitoxin system RelE/ParE family toxin [Acidobacteria bacterium]|nr:type II toxin-antitoxin system RelE/ParE family toxin [Acidobacteriota bacterium]
MKIVVLRSARRTVADGIRFYESQEAGLGAYFLTSIMADLRSLRIYGGAYQKYDNSFYRMVAKRFPCSIYYRNEHDDVYV